MKRLGVWIAAAVCAMAQTRDAAPRTIANGTAEPDSCSIGDLFVNTAAVPTLKLATATAPCVWTAQGSAGGNSLLSGTSGPTAAQGTDGAFYLRTDTSCLYGPKAGGAWPGSCTSLIGPQGAVGANGNTVLNGTSGPASGQGMNGDFFLRTDTSCLYGPKAGGAWPGSCMSLIGPQGPAGPAGSGGGLPVSTFAPLYITTTQNSASPGTTNAPIATLTIPANSLGVGSTFTIYAAGFLGTSAQVNLQVGSTQITIPGTRNNRSFELQARCTAYSTTSMVCSGWRADSYSGLDATSMYAPPQTVAFSTASPTAVYVYGMNGASAAAGNIYVNIFYITPVV